MLSAYILLWLAQDATGEKWLLDDGKEAKIYPGIVSNPEPNSEIANQFLVPIEMVWYQLATVENHCCLDSGITQGLESFLPKGQIFEGELLLTPAKIKKALILLDTKLFITALQETIAEFAYVKDRGDYRNSFNIHNVTYGSIPIPTKNQQEELIYISEQFVLCFGSNCIFSNNIAALDQIINCLAENQDFKIRTELLNSLKGDEQSIDYNTSLAELITVHRRAIEKKAIPSPEQVFELAFTILQVSVSGQTNSSRVIAKSAFVWLSAKWTFILNNQRFLLKCPNFYEKAITQACNAEDGSYQERLIALLQAMLPTLGIGNAIQLNQILKDLRKT
ncbi:MAG: hypothetical protein NTV43_16140 [Methylococcales bacterium]|nr:hypothetical protein [Methylococcales bacterium]